MDAQGKRHVSWYAVVDLPRRADGKRRQKWHGGFATRREAEVARADILQRLALGTYIEKNSMTVNEWAKETWLQLIEPQLKPTTLHSYRRNLELHLLPRLGHLRLRDLTPLLLTSTYGEILSTGRQRGRSKGAALSVTTIHYLHSILHHLLQDALDAGLLESNPASRARLPRHGSLASPEQRCWSATELAEFLDQSAHLPFALAWRLAAMTGMRRGEVLGLRWQDVNFSTKQLHVRRTLVSVGGVTHESTPKNGRPRLVDLDEHTFRFLRAHKPLSADEGDRLILDSDGKSPAPDALSRAFRSALRTTNAPPIRFHDLRHTHATLALAAGVPLRVVAERLGHSSPAFTLRRYAHVLPGMQAQAAETFAQMIHGTATQRAQVQQLPVETLAGEENAET